MYKTKAYFAASATSPLTSTTIPRCDPTEHDVQIEILFCGICHSDLHSVRNDWSEFMPTVYPIVPGHEIVGRVTKCIADQAARFRGIAFRVVQALGGQRAPRQPGVGLDPFRRHAGLLAVSGKPRLRAHGVAPVERHAHVGHHACQCGSRHQDKGKQKP